MRLGVLHPVREQLTLQQSVKFGLINFWNAPHCGRAGHTPAAVYFNPAELPEELEIEGLAVLPHEEVRPGFLRIATADLLPASANPFHEYYQAKNDFLVEVEAAAAP